MSSRWLAASLTAFGCFNPAFRSNLACDPNGLCPPGLTCGADRVCHEGGGSGGSGGNAGSGGTGGTGGVGGTGGSGGADAGVPTGIMLAMGQQGATGIAVDSNTVYWILPSNVMKCSIGGCGGNPTPLAAGANYTTSIVVDGGMVYWTTSDGVLACPAAGCGGGPATIASQQGRTLGLAIDATDLFFTAMGVRKCARTGCGSSPTTLAPNPGSGITTDGTNVYWVGQMGIQKCAVTGCGGTPSALATNEQFIMDGSDCAPALGGCDMIATDGANVYWLEQGGSPQNVHKCGVQGCGTTPILLEASQNQLQGIATDGQNVYWSAGGTIRKCSTAGCGGMPAVLVQGTANAIVLDNANVYWTDASGAVLKTPK